MIEMIKELQESQLINNFDYGLFVNVIDEQWIFLLMGVLMLDDFDELLMKVWKELVFFFMYLFVIVVFGCECMWCGVLLLMVSLFGLQFFMWCGILLILLDKVLVVDGKIKILLLCVGDKCQGVVGLYQLGVVGEQGLGLLVCFMGINNQVIVLYLILLYCLFVVYLLDVLVVFDDVEIVKFYDYFDIYC